MSTKTNMSACGKCFKSISRTLKEKLRCIRCNLWFHGPCVGLRLEEIDQLAKDSWSCDCCRASRELLRSNSDSTPISKRSCDAKDSPVTLSDIKDLKDVLFDMEKRILESQRRMENDLLARLESNSVIISSQQEILSKHNKVIEDMQKENTELRGKLELFTLKIDELEQYSRRSVVEIQGVPIDEREDLIDIIGRVGDIIDMKVEESVIDIIHRLKSNGNRTRPPGIVIKFTHRKHADIFVKKSRAAGRLLNVQRLGLPLDSPIYVNRSLTYPRRKLFAELWNLKKEGKISSVRIDDMGRVRAVGLTGGGAVLLNINDNYRNMLNVQ
jgi:hypothetical protein